MRKERTVPYLHNPMFSFEDTVVVMMKTSVINYQMAMLLNRCYQLDLARIPRDLEQGNKFFPYFKYENQSRQLTDILIDAPYFNSSDPVFAYYDKMLLIRGRDSWQFAQKLYNDVLNSQPRPQHANYWDMARWNNFNNLKSSVFDINIYSFSLPGQLQTTAGRGETEARSSRTPAYTDKMRLFIQEVFDIMMYDLSEEVYENANILTPPAAPAAPLNPKAKRIVLEL